MKTFLQLNIMVAVALSASAVGAQSPDLQARAWAASCAACHGTNGKSLGGIASIAGLDKQQLLDKLLAYKNGTLPATVMHQHAKGYTDAELARLADHFSRQPR
jgi:cytochrome subunit of sulfide dehydrogenase